MSEPEQLHSHLSPVRPLWRLKAERERRGWSQQELAHRLNVTPNSISRWERGISSPSLYFRRQLCDLFGRSPQELGFVSQSEANADQTIRADQAAAAFLPVTWHVPFQRNSFFTGREQALLHLHERLRADTKNASVPQALCGLAGMGKTQTAVEYCYRFSKEYQAVFWFRAETRETLSEDFVTIATLLDLPERDGRNQQRVVEAVKGWLSEHRNWLLVLDNLEDLNLIGEVIPSLHRGHVLLTMRRQATGTVAQSIQLHPMKQEEAVPFLLRRAGVLPLQAPLLAASAAEHDCAIEIAHLLDGLPLALDQAGAYIEETACGLSGYLERYRMQSSPLLRRRGEATSGHPASLTTTFALVAAQVEARNTSAADLLRLCAFLQPDTIPEAMIIEGTTGSSSILEPLARDPYAFDAAVKTLRDFSLIQRHAESKTLSLHRLVQAVVRDRLDEQARRQWVERTIMLMSRAFPDSSDDATWPRCQRYLPQAQACALLIEEWGLRIPEAGMLLLKAGSYQLEHGQFTQAEQFLLRARSILLDTVGEMHADYAYCLNSLALLYHYWGRYEQAEPLYQQALRISEQVHGTEHRAYIGVLTGLGGLYYNQGHYEQAEQLSWRVLKLREKQLGADHLDMAQLLNNVGGICMERGKYAQAETLLLRAVELREQHLGPEHPHTLLSLSSLATLYIAQQRYEQAESLQRRLLAVREKLWGTEHASVAASLYALAQLYHDQGHYEVAEPLYQRALTMRERVLGPEHPRTAQTLNGLARLLLEQGQVERGEELCRRSLAIREKALGPEHPDYAESLATLALLREQQGDESGAMLLYQQVLHICTGPLVPEHLLMMRCRAAYSRLLAKMPAIASPSSALDQDHASEAERQVPATSDEPLTPLDNFLTACCERDPRAWCRAADLWRAYLQWSEKQGERFPLSRRAFAQALKAQGCSPDRTNEYRIWRGVTLRIHASESVTPGDTK